MHDEDRRARGEWMFHEVYGDVVPLPPPGQRDDFLRLMLDQLFSEVWTRAALPIRDRRLLILGVIAAQGDGELFALQARAALANGELTREQIEEILITFAQYVGYPRASRLRSAAAAVLEEARR
jgi:4-carboxymuconolactone decarboxylase